MPASGRRSVTFSRESRRFVGQSSPKSCPVRHSWTCRPRPCSTSPEFRQVHEQRSDSTHRDGATLGWFDAQRKMYKKIPIDGQHDVIGMSGDIALCQRKLVVHTHKLVGSPEGTTQGGHVLEAYESPTLEVMVTEDPVTMQKRFDPATDLTLIDPALK
jgi:hypothetical protein